jgi:L-histidine N-alpha-methyltransferase
MRAAGLTRSAPAAGARTDLARAQFAAEVREHLLRTPRQLPTRYLYDELGSTLFEAICRLPWYRITRAEERLLGAARDDLARRIAALDTIVELGPGSGDKLRRLLSAPAFRALQLSAHLVDLSRSALETSRRTLAPLANVEVVLHEATYAAGLAEARRALAPEGRALVLFLGSNIGNFHREESIAFLREVRASIRPGDALLLGADLVKPEHELVLAYDDPLGVTAAFNKNLLVRINRELGADFDLPRYAHRAVWNAHESRIEMHLVAEADQRVRVLAAELELEIRAGETIWTESSYKYTERALDEMVASAGFQVAGRWTDHPDRFALTLAEAV